MDIESLSKFTTDRIKSIYYAVKERFDKDEYNGNNWVKKQYFYNFDSGFRKFVEDVATSVSNNDLNWYADDIEIIDWCHNQLKVSDFLYRPSQFIQNQQ